MFTTEACTLEPYKKGLSCVDYVIRFKDPHTSIEDVISISNTVFLMLMEDKKYEYGRLVARVSYARGEDDIVTYYHPSYAMELIHDNFFKEHMLKIGERMAHFNRHGSNLVIKRIDEIHIHVAFRQNLKRKKVKASHGKETQVNDTSKRQDQT